MEKRFVTALIFCFNVVLGSNSAGAALVPQLGGAVVYDTDLDISLVADANLVLSNLFGLTPGIYPIHPDDSTTLYGGSITTFGGMSYSGALYYIDAMNAANYLGFNDWRLPATLVPDAGCTGVALSTGFGCTGSELGHLFHVELGATAGTSVLTTGDPTEVAKFSNLLNASSSSGYWSGMDYNSDPNFAYFFRYDSGQQAGVSKNTPIGVWAVRDGSSVIPIPAAVWLFGSGLLGLIGITRRKKAA
jgi:hypothetical protein